MIEKICNTSNYDAIVVEATVEEAMKKPEFVMSSGFTYDM